MKKITIVSINCFRCSFRLTVSSVSKDLYEQACRMIGCPNGCQRPSLQIITKSK